MDDIGVSQDIEKKEHFCSNCSEKIDLEDIYCNACGFPERGTDSERAKFHANRVMKKNKYFDADAKVTSARNTLFAIGGFTILMGSIYYFTDQDIAILITNLILATIYLILGFWSMKKPLAAILSGLLLYITVTVLTGIYDPTTLYKGIIWKVLILSYLGKGLYSAKGIQK